MVYINFNFADHQGKTKVFEQAARNNLGIVVREAFMKGALFDMADEAGITDKTALAAAALKWVFSFDEVSTIVYGTGKVKNLVSSVSVLDSLTLNDKEGDMIDRIKQTERFKAYEVAKNAEFLQ